MRRLLFALILALSCCGSSAFATNYYVDYAGGNDANNGTSTATPKKNPPASLAAGDNVYFKGGVIFDNEVTVTHSGTAKAPIVYDGNSAGTWGTGRAIITGGGTRYNGFSSNAKSNITIKGFEIDNVATRPVSTWVGAGIYLVGTSTGLVIDNNYIHDIGWWEPDCLNPLTTYGVVSGAGIQVNSTTGAVIQNNILRRTGKGGIGLAGANHSRITNNDVGDHIQWLIDLNGDYSPGAVDNNYLGGNTIHDFYMADLAFRGAACAGHDVMHTDGMFIRKGSNVSPTNTVIDGNLFYNDNTFTDDTGGGTAAIFLSTAINTLLTNNVIINAHSTPSISLGWTSTGTKIYNNTIYTPRAGTVPISVAAINGGDNTVIKNNILIGADSSINLNSADNNILPYLVCDNNIFNAAGNLARQVSQTGGYYHTIAQWRAHGFDLATIVADNAAAVGFDNTVGYPATSSAVSLALVEGSIAIDNGTALPTVVESDILGAERPLGSAWDIGAYEYASGTPADNTAPTVPGNVVATPNGYTTGVVSWGASTDAVGVVGYLIYRDGALVGTTAASPFADSGLTVATAYSYTVAAYDAAGNVSATSDAAAMTTFDYPVARPAILQGTWQ